MTLLSTVQHFYRRINQPVPSTVYGSTDTMVLQIMALLEEEGNDLATRHDWNVLTREASHTTLANEDQGALTSIATNGFRHIKNDTIWDRTNHLQVFGPLDNAQWQANKAVSSTGPRYQYRIRGNHLLVNPTPTAGYSWYFEYVSKNWILDDGGTVYKQFFTVDNDTILLPEDLVLMGLRWRWKKEKGFDYAEDFRTYEMQVKDAIGKDGSKHNLSMDGGPKNKVPGIFVPQYSWNLP